MSCCKKKDKIDCCMQDHLVCVCMGVMSSEIYQAIDDGYDTFDLLSEKLEVGVGCSSCVSEIHEMIKCKKNGI